jgi:hypothetical protein
MLLQAYPYFNRFRVLCGRAQTSGAQCLMEKRLIINQASNGWVLVTETWDPEKQAWNQNILSMVYQDELVMIEAIKDFVKATHV